MADETIEFMGSVWMKDCKIRLDKNVNTDELNTLTKTKNPCAVSMARLGQ